jgi:hypothetical protein
VKPQYRTVLAFLGASVFPAAYLAVVFPLSGERDLPSVLGTFLVAYWFSALAAGLVGLPAFLLLSKFNLVAWWSAVGCGALAGIAALVAVSDNTDGATALRFSALGAGAGLLFWLVLRSGPAWPPRSNGA